MSYSKVFHAVGSIAIPINMREAKHLAMLLSDIVEILGVQETAIDLMLCNTRPDDRLVA